MPVPRLERSNLRSSARLREKRKRATGDEDDKENVIEREPFEASNDTMFDLPEPGPSRPSKRRKIVHDHSEDSEGSEDSEDSDIGESDEADDTAGEAEPTSSPSNSAQECRIGGCRYTLSNIYKVDWAHTKIKGHLPGRNADNRFPCTYPGCPGLEEVSGYRDKSDLRRHILSDHWGEKIECSWPGCTASYSREDTLARHRKTHTE